MNFKKVLIILTSAAFLFIVILFSVKLNQPEEVEVIPEYEVDEELIMSGHPGPVTKLKAGETLNINTATAEELTALPGIGDVLAQRIVAYRDAHGGFTSVEEIMNVSGIGQKRFESLRDFITLED